MRKFGWGIAIAIFSFLALRGLFTGIIAKHERSQRINMILQRAQSYQESDDKISSALEEAADRSPRSYAEFNRQCSDLEVAIANNDEMERRKREMLAELQPEFSDDSKVQPIFSTLRQLEDVSDKIESAWRGMIACSDRLSSADHSHQDKYETICVVPERQQIRALAPEIKRFGTQLQSEVQSGGGSLPAAFLQVLRQ